MLRQKFVSILKESKHLLEASNDVAHPFGPWSISEKEIFFMSKFTIGFVNLKPILPGHVLIAPRRVSHRFENLSSEEVSDLWVSAQVVGAMLERMYKATSLTLSMQDGVDAGQTVPHVHIHVIPRVANDFKHNDEIYTKLDSHNSTRSIAKVDDEDRQPRTESEMAHEANQIRNIFSNAISEDQENM